MKASVANQAAGVHLIRSVRDVERVVSDPANEGMREWVMQRYIRRRCCGSPPDASSTCVPTCWPWAV